MPRDAEAFMPGEENEKETGRKVRRKNDELTRRTEARCKAETRKTERLKKTLALPAAAFG
jgi:hypothetical protein